MRLLQLVTDLVDLGALQSGAYRLDVSSVKIRPLLESCLEQAQLMARERAVALECGMAPGVPPMLQTDETRLRQLVLILLDRAIDTSRRGRVSVWARLGSPSSASDGDRFCAGSCLELVVADSGPGLTTEERERLFARASAGERSEGAGLSLALARRLCEVLGGRLVLDTDGSAGTTFIARLPLGLPAEAEVREPAWSPVMPTGV